MRCTIIVYGHGLPVEHNAFLSNKYIELYYISETIFSAEHTKKGMQFPHGVLVEKQACEQVNHSTAWGVEKQV